jgi:hypothetical protein
VLLVGLVAVLLVLLLWPEVASVVLLLLLLLLLIIRQVNVSHVITCGSRQNKTSSSSIRKSI